MRGCATAARLGVHLGLPGGAHQDDPNRWLEQAVLPGRHAQVSLGLRAARMVSFINHPTGDAGGDHFSPPAQANSPCGRLLSVVDGVCRWCFDNFHRIAQADLCRHQHCDLQCQSTPRLLIFHSAPRRKTIFFQVGGSPPRPCCHHRCRPGHQVVGERHARHGWRDHRPDLSDHLLTQGGPLQEVLRFCLRLADSFHRLIARRWRDRGGCFSHTRTICGPVALLRRRGLRAPDSRACTELRCCGRVDGPLPGLLARRHRTHFTHVCGDGLDAHRARFHSLRLSDP
mmetsp:Transcript_83889/g.167442  ORF Transcript_83889/g.167442 Transcript_83889/m.167442 type:complete len:285 (+) Transcript_83889:967-1821(+)